MFFSKLLNFLASFSDPLDYHRCAAGEIFLNFRVVFFQKIEENDSFTVIMTLAKKFCGDGDNFFSVKVTMMPTLSFFPVGDGQRFFTGVGYVSPFVSLL